ncbi:MAG: FkbM family methyltransferase [Halothiobacillaceae bacterium]|nr:FkbM family methyltransferase [Halothiobacillaceae bacterium]HER34262.1 FkbM family methyltransferase [Halothiobacillaceae bacterium]
MMLKGIGKEFEWYLRLWRLAPALLRQYGTLKPDRVRLPRSRHVVYIDTDDRRAMKRILLDAVRGRYPINRRFWVDFVQALDPGLALDVGTNYGECVFATDYGAGTQVYAFEANPTLHQYLQRSKESHSSAERIHLVNALVDERPRGAVPFFVNTRWSGGSTAVQEVAEEISGRREVRVETISIDSVLADWIGQVDTLVFKMDIEGFEPFALKGMARLLDSVETAVGFVEVDLRFLEKSGWTPAAYDEAVLDGFRLFVSDGDSETRFREVPSLSAHVRHDSQLHFDLLLIKGWPQRLPEGWELAPG